LAHIPASKRGEALLKERLGIMPMIALISPMPKVTLDNIGSGNLTLSQVDALDALFSEFNRVSKELFAKAS